MNWWMVSTMALIVVVAVEFIWMDYYRFRWKQAERRLLGGEH